MPCCRWDGTIVERHDKGWTDITVALSSSFLAPQHTSPIYFNDLRRYSMLSAVVGDSLSTRLNHVVVVDDAETAGRQSRVERVERLYRRFVQVAIKPQDSDAIDRASGSVSLNQPGRKQTWSSSSP